MFERRTSTRSEAFSLFLRLDTNKFVLLSFFSLIKTINPRVSTKPLPNDALPVDVRRSKTPLLKLPNNCKVRSATPNYDLVLVLDTLYDNGHYVTEIANTASALIILCSDGHSFINWFSKTTAEGR